MTIQDFPGRYQTKAELVVTMQREVVGAGCPAAYLVGNTAFTGCVVSKDGRRLGLVWIGTLAPRTTVVYRGRRQAVPDRDAQPLPERYYNHD